MVRGGLRRFDAVSPRSYRIQLERSLFDPTCLPGASKGFDWKGSFLMTTARTPTFLGRYQEPLPIRSRGAYQLVSARREADGTPCVLVLPGANANKDLIRSALAEVQEAHERINHPLVPKVTGNFEHDGIPYLELDCDATLDGEDIVRLVAESGRRLPYTGADGFIRSLRMAIQAGHAARHPTTDAPYFLGRLSLRNVLFTTSGKWFLVGFGRNFPLERDDRALDGETVFFAAPELANGGAPSPMGDYVALLLFMRSFMPYVESMDAIGRILRGEISVLDGELFKLLTWVELRVFAAPAALRATMDEAINAADRIRELVGRFPNPAMFETFLADLIAAADETSDTALTPAPRTLTVGPDAEWIAGPDGAKHPMGRASRRIVQELVARHRRGAPALSVPEVLSVGWPGEHPIAAAGTNRVHVELNRLRRLGLRDLLERSSEGYRLASDTVVRETRSGPLAALLGRR